MHQYRLDTTASYGGVRLAIDANYVRLGRRPAGVGTPAGCGPKANRTSYPLLRRGVTSKAVRAVRCLLREDTATSRYGGKLKRAVAAFQRARDLPASGRVGPRTWTALLARGHAPLVKRGSTGPSVRRVQRALNAALSRGPRINGYYGPLTVDTVKRYQRRIGHSATGVVTARTWRALRHGRVGSDQR